MWEKSASVKLRGYVMCALTHAVIPRFIMGPLIIERYINAKALANLFQKGTSK